MTKSPQALSAFFVFVILFSQATTQACFIHDQAFATENLKSFSPETLKYIEHLDQQDMKLFEDYKWLYEKLMPENLRRNQASETEKSFRVHLKDSFKFFPDPDFIAKKNLNDYSKTTEMTGFITYAGIFRKPYKMTLKSTHDDLSIVVRIHLKNPSAQDKIDFAAKVKTAEDLWNNSRIKTDFKYTFHFKIVESQKEAHYSVNILNETRGPYDTNWGRDWTGNTIAHEIGHMLGLGDEYQTISGEFDCLRSSLMCSAWYGAHMKHHYYFVLRRFMKNESARPSLKFFAKKL